MSDLHIFHYLFQKACEQTVKLCMLVCKIRYKNTTILLNVCIFIADICVQSICIITCMSLSESHDEYHAMLRINVVSTAVVFFLCLFVCFSFPDLYNVSEKIKCTSFHFEKYPSHSGLCYHIVLFPCSIGTRILACIKWRFSLFNVD